MKSDLQALEIRLGELKRLTTFNLKEVVFKGKKQIKETINIFSVLIRWLLSTVGVLVSIGGMIYFIMGILVLIGIVSFDTGYSSEIEEKVLFGWMYVSFGVVLTSIGIFLIIFSKKILRGNFSPFINEVNQHNQIILNISILDQLEAVGNPVKLNEREKVIEALKINRENIVRALQTERILKENPQFRPEQFNIDLSGLRALEATEKATKYGKFLDEALQIGVSVQTEMRKLENKRLGL